VALLADLLLEAARKRGWRFGWRYWRRFRQRRRVARSAR
jgi:hypothetical protein